MNTHVDLDIADFVAGRLPQARRKEIEDHLRKCETCAMELAWANEFRDQALRQGLRHLDPMRIVELSHQAEGASEAEQEHLTSCADCQAELTWSGERATPDAVPPSDRRARRKPILLAFLAAAAMIVGVLLLMPRGTRLDPFQFAMIEPLPVRNTRSTAEPGSFEESRMLGLEAYAAGNYVAAREHFLHAISMESDRPELLLYLGSAELLEDNLNSAELHLRQATEHAPAGTVRDEASWQLANALLLLRRADEATQLLSMLADREGRRRDDSLAMLEAIDGMQ